MLSVVTSPTHSNQNSSSPTGQHKSPTDALQRAISAGKANRIDGCIQKEMPGFDNPLSGPNALSPERLVELKNAFREFDRNGDEQIDVHELDQVLESLGISNTNQNEREALIRELDADGDGEIGFAEFIRFCRNVEEGARKLDDLGVPDTASNGGASEVHSQAKSPRHIRMHVRGLLDLVRTGQREEERKVETYITDKKKVVRQRIYDLLYKLPSFAPDYVYRRWWDVLILAIMLIHWVFAAVQGIFKVSPTQGILIVEGIVSIILIADIVVNVNTAVQAEDRSFLLIVDRTDIFKLYLRSGHFFIDFLSGVPFDVVFYLIMGVDAWRFLRFLRLLKILKFPHLFTLTDRGNMDPSFVQFYFWTVPLLKIGAKFLFSMNILTIGRMVIAGSPADSCVNSEFGLDKCTESIVNRYLFSLWWCWALLTTQGLAKISGGREYTYAAFVMFMSLLLQGFFVAHMSALFLKSNVAEQNKDNMRATLGIMRQYCIPSSLQQEVLSFQYHSLQQNASSGFKHILERLPKPMQKEVGLYVRVGLIAKVPMFEDLSIECKLELANCLDQTFCEPDCFIIQYGEKGDEMYFMMHGFADVIIPSKECGDSLGRVVTTVKRGDYFGEMALLKPSASRNASIQALTYCDLFELHNDHFEKLLAGYDELRDKVQSEAIRRGLNNEPETSSTASNAGQIDYENVLGRSQRRRTTLLLSDEEPTPMFPPVSAEVWADNAGSGIVAPLSPRVKKNFRKISSFHATRSFKIKQEVAGHRRQLHKATSGEMVSSFSNSPATSPSAKSYAKRISATSSKERQGLLIPDVAASSTFDPPLNTNTNKCEVSGIGTTIVSEGTDSIHTHKSTDDMTDFTHRFQQLDDRLGTVCKDQRAMLEVVSSIDTKLNKFLKELMRIDSLHQNQSEAGLYPIFRAGAFRY